MRLIFDNRERVIFTVSKKYVLTVNCKSTRNNINWTLKLSYDFFVFAPLAQLIYNFLLIN